MIERFIQHVSVEFPAPAETVDTARERLGGQFPRTALRRMTHLGLLVGAALREVTWGPADALVYASTFAEARALEEYLASFPTASPLSFQTSVHPSAVQQVAIGRQQPLARLWPLAGGARLVEQAWRTALLDPGPRVIVAGGEETGTWLTAHGLASARAFAFALVLAPEAAGALGVVRGAPAPAEPDETGPSLIAFAEALAARRPLAWLGGETRWELEWR